MEPIDNTYRGFSAIDPSEVCKMASIGCTADEIAEKYGVSTSVITGHFRRVYHMGISQLHETLRQALIDCALKNKGNSTMLIFLGKAYLNMKDGMNENRLSDLDLMITKLKEQAACSNSPPNS